jgi:hypothetical protein
MASGSMVGMQHALLDMPELTKEEFLKHCDEQFYNMGYFGMTLEQAQNRMRNNQQERIDRLKTTQAEYKEFIGDSPANLDLAYRNYKIVTELANEKRLEEFKREKSRMIVIRQWSEQFPLLKIFERFVEPNLYLSEVLSFQEWFADKVAGFERTIRYNQEDIGRYAHTVDEEKTIVDLYEQAKIKFMEVSE